MKDKLLCVKDVVMDDGSIAFNEGQTYKADLDRYYVIAINNDKEDHCLGRRYDEDKWFITHFKTI
jgi:hypothetical protein